MLHQCLDIVAQYKEKPRSLWWLWKQWSAAVRDWCQSRLHWPTALPVSAAAAAARCLATRCCQWSLSVSCPELSSSRPQRRRDLSELSYTHCVSAVSVQHSTLSSQTTLYSSNISYWVKALRPTRHKIGHFGDVLPSQSLGLELKKLNITQQKQTTQEQSSLS